MHVLLESGKPLTRESVIEALRQGHAFVGFDVLGDTSGFRFWAESASDGKVQPPVAAGGTDISQVDRRIMGDEIALSSGVKLSAATPGASRMVVLRNGAKVAEFPDVTKFSLNVTEKGIYRVEAYLDQLGEPFDQAPWIMSNPIYVR
jgi:hypothetical protein